MIRHFINIFGFFVILDHTFWQQTFPTLSLTSEATWSLLLESVTPDARQVKQHFFTRFPNSDQKGIDVLLETLASSDKATQTTVAPWLDQLGQQLLITPEIPPLAPFLMVTCINNQPFSAAWGVRVVINYLRTQPIDVMTAHLNASEPLLVKQLVKGALRSTGTQQFQLIKEIWDTLVLPIQQGSWDGYLTKTVQSFIEVFNRDGLLNFIEAMGAADSSDSVKTLYYCLATNYPFSGRKTLLHSILEDKYTKYPIMDDSRVQLLIRNIAHVYAHDPKKSDMLHEILHAKEVYDLENEIKKAHGPSALPLAFLMQWKKLAEKYLDAFNNRLKALYFLTHLNNIQAKHQRLDNHYILTCETLAKDLFSLSLDDCIEYISLFRAFYSNTDKPKLLMKEYLVYHGGSYLASECITKLAQNGFVFTESELPLSAVEAPMPADVMTRSPEAITDASNQVMAETERRFTFSLRHLRSSFGRLFASGSSNGLPQVKEEELGLLSGHGPRIGEYGTT